MCGLSDAIRLQNRSPDIVKIISRSRFSLLKHRLERPLNLLPFPTFNSLEKSLNIGPNFNVVTFGQAAQYLMPVSPELAQLRRDNLLSACGRSTVSLV